MSEKTKIERTLKYRAGNFRTWDKEKQENVISDTIDSLFINEIVTENGNKFFEVDVKTKDGRTHSTTLRSPRTEAEKEIFKKLNSMTEEEKKELLNKLK